MIKNFEELNQVRAKCASCLSAKFTGADGQRHVVLCGGTGCLSSRADEITAEFNKLVKENGYKYTFVVSGKQEGVGLSYSEITEFVLYDKGGNDITGNYKFSFQKGTLQLYLKELSV